MYSCEANNPTGVTRILQRRDSEIVFLNLFKGFREENADKDS